MESAQYAINQAKKGVEKGGETMPEKIPNGLNSCPFCGSTHVGDAGLWRHVIKCYDCGAQSKPNSKWEEAVNSWNTRSLTPSQAHADELYEALGYVLTQLRLAFMGFNSINIDANKLQALYDTIAGEENGDDT